MENAAYEEIRAKRPRVSQRVDEFLFGDMAEPFSQSLPPVHTSQEVERQLVLEDKLLTRLFELGLKRATPKLILALMADPKQLTKENVKSRLQKFRLYSKRFTEEFLRHYHTNIEDEVKTAPVAAEREGSREETPSPHGIGDFVTEVEGALEKLKEIYESSL